MKRMMQVREETFSEVGGEYEDRRGEEIKTLDYCCSLLYFLHIWDEVGLDTCPSVLDRFRFSF